MSLSIVLTLFLSITKIEVAVCSKDGYLDFSQCDLTAFKTMAKGETWHNFFLPCESAINTTSPVLYPTSDDKIREILRLAREKKCHVRVSGATHTASGIVTSAAFQENTVVISLADYETEKNWTNQLDGSADTIRMAAGKSLLDLYAFIRPKGYFLATHNDEYSFSLAGIIANHVHGGNRKYGFVYSLVTSMRIMNAGGKIDYVTGSNLRYYKGAFGLTGIITAVEFKVEKFSHYCMESNGLWFHWNQENFEDHLNKLFKHQHTDFAEYFLTRDFDESKYSGKAHFVGNRYFSGKAAAECDPLKSKTSNEKQKLFNETYSNLLKMNPNIRKHGDKHAKHIEEGTEQYGLAYAFGARNGALLAMQRIIGKANLAPNDGFWFPNVSISVPGIGMFKSSGTAPGQYMEIYFKIGEDSAKDQWKVITLWDDWVQKHVKCDSIKNCASRYIGTAEEFSPNQPAEVRYVNITQHNYDQDSVLAPLKPGFYIAFDVINIGYGYKYLWAKPYADLAQKFQESGGIQSVTKIFCFGGGDNPRPFDRACMEKYFPEEQQKEFMKYRDSVDPEGIFFAGEAVYLVAKGHA